eukprot:8966283-Lingulodinium_polyedra.AAC.1
MRSDGHPAPQRSRELSRPPGRQAAQSAPGGRARARFAPLRGSGEAGSEHLLQWRPAVEGAWAGFNGEEGLLRAIRAPGGREPLLARFLHQ